MRYLFLFLLILSCNQDFKIVDDYTEVRTKLITLGFNPEGFYKVSGGYMVEGDLFIPDEDLTFIPNNSLPSLEQYRTTDLVKVNGIKTITISLDNSLASISGSLDDAITRYNAETLSINFQRVNNAANIKITQTTNTAYVASAGFPSAGKPYKSILVNLNSLTGQPQATIATILAHEMGHCIGFRHTDYYDISISCGGNLHITEGIGKEGAVLIPGTPDTAAYVAQSWMLACIGSGQNRPFNADDKIALHYLY